jgi:hypothetical protein
MNDPGAIICDVEPALLINGQRGDSPKVLRPGRCSEHALRDALIAQAHQANAIGHPDVARGIHLDSRGVNDAAVRVPRLKLGEDPSASVHSHEGWLPAKIRDQHAPGSICGDLARIIRFPAPGLVQLDGADESLVRPEELNRAPNNVNDSNPTVRRDRHILRAEQGTRPAIVVLPEPPTDFAITVERNQLALHRGLRTVLGQHHEPAVAQAGQFLDGRGIEVRDARESSFRRSEPPR